MYVWLVVGAKLCEIAPLSIQLAHAIVAKLPVQRTTKEIWEQIKTAYSSGIDLREIARKMNVPEGTVLARAKREGWTQQMPAAKLVERPPSSAR